jgi:cysteine synthase A
MPGYRFNLTIRLTLKFTKLTAQEIIKDFPDGLDYMITGVGTGGHITGCAEILKQHYPNLKVFAVEPEASPVISGGAPGPHPLQGIGRIYPN